ncbi:BTB/POZ domain-containing protein At5g47800 [Linum perenne]
MKFMKLGSRPDTFYTEEATRSLVSDVPSDLVIRINGITYLLHKLQFALLSKCGLLQRLCSDTPDSSPVTVELHDIPGGEEAFELCAKYCYGITISLSAHNIVPAFCAAKFLRMTESVDNGNFVLKLEAFFNSCVLESWKDPILALQTTVKLTEWSENLGIIRRCIDSIVDKIITPPTKVRWSFTYTRPGFNKHEQSVPKDWWTEDITDLDIDLFRCIITAIKSTYLLPPQLIGEALHVYACRWLPDAMKLRPPDRSESSSQARQISDKERRVLETIVSMIPVDRGSVSVGFLLRLLNIANYLAASPATKAELIRRSSLQLEEATLSDLLFPSHSSLDQHLYDVDSISAILESFLVLWRRISQEPVEESQIVTLIRRVGKLIDSYLQVVAKDQDMPVSKLVSLAEALPDIARINHDDLYKAINNYLKASFILTFCKQTSIFKISHFLFSIVRKQEHPDLSKADRKQLCRMLDCQNLSPEVRAHAVKNERLPLRTVVQVLFFEQEIQGSRETNSRILSQQLSFKGQQTSEMAADNLSKLHLVSNGQPNKVEGLKKSSTPESSSTRSQHERVRKHDRKLEEKKVVRGEIEEEVVEKGKQSRGGGGGGGSSGSGSGSKLDARKVIGSRSGSDHGRDKVRDR